jgi:hypothetical protein
VGDFMCPRGLTMPRSRANDPHKRMTPGSCDPGVNRSRELGPLGEAVLPGLNFYSIDACIAVSGSCRPSASTRLPDVASRR